MRTGVAPEENKTGTMKDEEITIGRPSPCVQIFIELILSAELAKIAARKVGCTEKIDRDQERI
jgi:hypothetical protein